MFLFLRKMSLKIKKLSSRVTSKYDMMTSILVYKTSRLLFKKHNLIFYFSIVLRRVQKKSCIYTRAYDYNLYILQQMFQEEIILGAHQVLWRHLLAGQAYPQCS